MKHKLTHADEVKGGHDSHMHKHKKPAHKMGMHKDKKKAKMKGK